MVKVIAWDNFSPNLCYDETCMEHEWIIVSVGGSLIVPNSIDIQFLSSFKKIILEEIAAGKKFVIITGGGRTARAYQEAGNTVTPLSADDQDWLGIHATRLNAHLLRAVFYREAHPKIITDPIHDTLPGNADIVIAAGFRPGASTDLRAVEIAERLGAKKLANLSNIDFVYDKNPKEFPDATPLPKVSWSTFRTLIPDHWDPGLSSPFDPVAATRAEELSLEVAIINGEHIEEFKKYIEGAPFQGTIIDNIQ